MKNFIFDLNQIVPSTFHAFHVKLKWRHSIYLHDTAWCLSSKSFKTLFL